MSSISRQLDQVSLHACECECRYSYNVVYISLPPESNWEERGEEEDERSWEERRDQMLLGGEVARIMEERGEEGDVVERKEMLFGAVA